MEKTNLRAALLASLLFVALPGMVLADNTATVFGPVVNEGHRSWEYRGAWNPDADRIIHRLHYQQSLNDRYMLRGLVNSREDANGDLDLDYFQAELFMQFDTSRSNWQSGMRFDLRVRDDNRPELFGAHWTNQFKLSEGWQARVLAMTTREFGTNRGSGIGLQTRGRLWTRHNDIDFGLELFNNYGRTTQDLSFSEQNHQAGLFAAHSFGDGWYVFGSVLLGVSDAAPDENVQFFFGRRLR